MTRDEALAHLDRQLTEVIGDDLMVIAMHANIGGDQLWMQDVAGLGYSTRIITARAKHLIKSMALLNQRREQAAEAPADA
jgi:hypothetical protein